MHCSVCTYTRAYPPLYTKLAHQTVYGTHQAARGPDAEVGAAGRLDERLEASDYRRGRRDEQQHPWCSACVGVRMFLRVLCPDFSISRSVFGSVGLACGLGEGLKARHRCCGSCNPQEHPCGDTTPCRLAGVTLYGADTPVGRYEVACGVWGLEFRVWGLVEWCGFILRPGSACLP